MRFTTALVTEYAKKKAFSKKLEAWAKEIRDFFVEQMQAGVPCPSRGPYVLVLSPDSRPMVAWDDELRKFVAKVKIKEGKPRKVAEREADEYLEAIAKKAQKEERVKLLVKANPKYRKR